VERIGGGPKRRCETVIEPDFFESYTKWPCPARPVCSAMILIDALLALTVPSEPRP